MLAADAELELGVGPPAPLGAEVHQLADAALVDRLERVALEQTLLEVGRHHPALDVVTAEAERHLGEVVGAEREEVGLLGDLVGADRRPRRLDHRADDDVGLLLQPLSGAFDLLLDPGAGQVQLLTSDGQRNHHLDDRVLAALAQVGGRLHQGAHLHAVELRLDDAEADTTGADHRVVLGPRLGGGEHLLLVVVEAGRRLLDVQLLDRGQEFVQRRVEQADRHRQAIHRFEHLLEVGALDVEQLGERLVLFVGRRRQDHLAHDREPVGGQEHVLGAAQADALGAETAGVSGVLTGVGVGADTELALANRVGPAEHDVELLRWLGERQVHRADDDFPGGAVDRDDVALVDRHAVGGERSLGDLHRVGADDRWGAPATSDDGGVADETATGGEDALTGHHPVDVLGTRLAADEDHLLAPLGGGFGVVGGEIDSANRRSWRGGETLGDDLALADEPGVEDLVEVVGGHPRERLGPRDLPALGTLAGATGHVDGHPQRGGPGALADASLEHPQLALFDGELGVAHVLVVAFQTGEDVEQVLLDLGEVLAEGVEVLGVADPGHDVLALSVDEEVAVRLVLPGRRVASEADARAGVVVAVAEDHRLHVDGSAEVVADPLAHAVGDRPGAVPASEDRFDGAAQLLDRVLREGLAGLLLDHRLVLGAQLLEGGGRQVGVTGHPGSFLGGFERVLEQGPVDVQHDSAVHRDEPAVGVVGEALVVGGRGEALDALVVESEVEDGVHHPGHRELGPGAHADEQRVGGIAETASHLLLQGADLLGDLTVEFFGPAARQIGAAGVGGDREPAGHGQLEHAGHLGEVGALAAKEVLQLHRGTAVLVIEGVDVWHDTGVYDPPRNLRAWPHVRNRCSGCSGFRCTLAPGSSSSWSCWRSSTKAASSAGGSPVPLPGSR